MRLIIFKGFLSTGVYMVLETHIPFFLQLYLGNKKMCLIDTCVHKHLCKYFNNAMYHCQNKAFNDTVEFRNCRKLAVWDM